MISLQYSVLYCTVLYGTVMVTTAGIGNGTNMIELVVRVRLRVRVRLIAC